MNNDIEYLITIAITLTGYISAGFIFAFLVQSFFNMRDKIEGRDDEDQTTE